MNENARMIARIERNLNKVGEESRRVLTYIKGELTPEATERRSHDDLLTDVKHLHAVANTHLRSIEPRKEAS